MGQLLFRASSLVAFLLLGFFLKRLGYLGQKDYQILSKIVLGVTLPAAALTNFASYTLDPALLLCIALGFLLNWFYLLPGLLLSRNKPLPQRAIWANCVPSYNVGTFCLPFVQSFLSPIAVVACCLFDAGNALMCNGGTFALTCGLLGQQSKFSPRDFLKKLFTSIPFVAYLTLLGITLLQIPIPDAVVQFVSPAASAHTFLAMFMLGTMFDLRLEKSLLRQIAGILSARFVLSAAAAAVCYFLLPLPLAVRQAMALVVFSPVSVTSTALSQKAGGDPALAGCVNSFSIPISICCAIVLLTFFGTI